MKEKKYLKELFQEFEKRKLKIINYKEIIPSIEDLFIFNIQENEK